MKIIVENCMFMNSGDAAIQVATEKILRAVFPDATFTYFDSGAPAIQPYYPDYDIRPMVSSVVDKELPIRIVHRFAKKRRYFQVRQAYLAGLTRAVKLLRSAGLPMPLKSMRAMEPYMEADLVVTAGGTYLVSKYNLTARLLEFQKDAALGLPLVFFTQSIEPFQIDFRSNVLKEHFITSPLILVRHPDSARNVRALTGSDENVIAIADSVFALWSKGPTSLKDRRERVGRDPDAPLQIAVSVRSLTDFGDRTTEEGTRLYHQAVRNAVVWMVREQGASVTFLSTCQGVTEYWLDDSETALEVAGGLPEDVRRQVKVDRDFHSPEALIEAAKGFDLIIASRLHMAIMSVCANTPVLSISYESKFEETFYDLGRPDLVTKVGEIDQTGFQVACARWIEEIDVINADLQAAAETMYSSAMSAGPLIKKALPKD